SIGVLTALGVHFVLGSGAIGNAMLPLLEINKDNAGDIAENGDVDTLTTASGPVVQAHDDSDQLSAATTKTPKYPTAA
ncbi:MAG: hypothetical protein QX203_12025, partial [Methylococcaceae bacterium]